MIRALIVDDERPARERLRRLLEARGDVQVVGEAQHGVEALEQVGAHQPDIVFLDIEMPELDGLGVADALGESAPHIVFTTAYDEYALKAFEAAALDYLQKPIGEAHLERALARHRAAIPPTLAQLADLARTLDRSGAPRRVALKSGARYLVVDVSRIVAVVAEDHYAVVKEAEGEHLCDETLDAIHRRLPGGRFLRIHRSAIISLDAIASLEREGDRRYVAVMSSGDLRLPVSRDRLPEIKRALGIASP